jgi:hypothetical protein
MPKVAARLRRSLDEKRVECEALVKPKAIDLPVVHPPRPQERGAPESA